jgi:hypothetical protein
LISGATTSITVEYPGMDTGYGSPTTSLLCYIYAGERTFFFGFYQIPYTEYGTDGSTISTGVRNVQY